MDAKIIFESDCVYMLKRCPEHGFQRVLMADDVDYYIAAAVKYSRASKPPEMPPRHWNTAVKGNTVAPMICGLCPDYEQHSCLSLLEITDACNLNCPICYANSGTHRTTHRKSVPTGGTHARPDRP